VKNTILGEEPHPDREYVLIDRPDNGIRDACNVWLESTDGSLGMRLGIEAVAEQWDSHDIWFDLAFATGRVLSFRGAGPNTSRLDNTGKPSIFSAGGLQFQCLEPLKKWSVSFTGEAEELDAGTLARGAAGFESIQSNLLTVQLDIDLTMAGPAWLPGSLSQEAAAILAGDDGDFMSPRYEQLCRADGCLVINEEAIDFKGNGLRIRRTGYRAFSGFRGHCWQSAVFPDGRAFGFNTYPPEKPGATHYREGFIIENGQRIPAIPIEVPWLRQLRQSGDDVSFVLQTNDGRRIAITGETFINTRSRSHKTLPPDFPIVQQAHAWYRWGGVETTGMLERSSLPELIEISDK